MSTRCRSRPKDDLRCGSRKAQPTANAFARTRIESWLAEAGPGGAGLAAGFIRARLFVCGSLSGIASEGPIGIGPTDPSEATWHAESPLLHAGGGKPAGAAWPGRAPTHCLLRPRLGRHLVSAGSCNALAWHRQCWAACSRVAALAEVLLVHGPVGIRRTGDGDTAIDSGNVSQKCW
jgi:hypothetical protein